MAKKATKAAAVLEMINKGMSNKEIRNRFIVSPGYLWKLRNQMAHRAEESDDNVVRPRVVGKHKVARVTKKQAEARKAVEATIQSWSAEPEIDEILTERGNRYGAFISHAHVTYNLKEVAHNFAYEFQKRLSADQWEALDMIFHKIGRILNGDPNYADSWVDIAGYAKLVADRLEGKVR